MKKGMLLFGLLLQTRLFAAAASWIAGSSPPNWNTGSGWSTGTPPNAISDIANFGSSITTATPTIILDVNTTLGSLTLDFGTNITINPAAAQTFTFNNGGSATLTVTNSNGNGAHTILPGMTLTDPLTISQTSSGTLTLSGVIQGAQAIIMPTTSTGTLSLTGVNTFSGGVTLNAGTLLISADTALGNTAGSITFPASSTATFQAGNTFSTSASRSFVLTGPAIIDSQSNQLTLAGQVGLMGNTGSLTKVGTGTLILSNGGNLYSGGTTVSGGTLSISADANLGASGAVTIGNGGTLQITSTLSSSRNLSLTGSGTGTATINTGGGVTATLSGTVSGAGSLTKTGTGTLSLATGNSYTGGTILGAGTLSIANDSALGSSTTSLSIGTATLATSAAISSSRAITLTGSPSTIDTGAFTDSFTGTLSGTGSLTKAGAGILALTGTNSYTGGTTVSAGTLQGDTNGLQGTITNSGAAVVFTQTFDGTYAGALGGTGTLAKTGSGAVTFSGTNGFSGTTAVSAGSLIVNGSLTSSTITVGSGATLGGTGNVGPVINNGTISPGNSIGTLTVNGNLTLNGSSTLDIEIEPTQADQLIVTGTATLNGAITITPISGFYGPSVSYTILTSTGLAGSFSSNPTSSDSNFSPTISTVGNNIVLTVRILNPFLNFPFTNGNTESVGENLGALSTSGTLSPTLTNVINSFVGVDFDLINDALDQMHPAQYSALTEVYTEVDAFLLSYFHRKPFTQWMNNCGCSRLWAEPFGQWLEMEPKGEQIGFGADTGGVALGWDRALTDRFSLGVGGAYQYSKLEWDSNRGHVGAQGYYGAFYGDYASDNFYWGFALLAGENHYDGSRHLEFTTFNQNAEADFSALDIASNLSLAYFVGSPAAYLFPYANLDFFYQKADSFEETGASGLNLSVDANTSKTLRTEMGLGLTVNDRNYDETMCISPFVSLGWVMVSPLERQKYTATFEGVSIPYQVEGWDHTWQMLAADFGLQFAYHCFTLGLEYHVELTPDRNTTLFNQVGNATLEWKW